MNVARSAENQSSDAKRPAREILLPQIVALLRASPAHTIDTVVDEVTTYYRESEWPLDSADQAATAPAMNVVNVTALIDGALDQNTTHRLIHQAARDRDLMYEIVLASEATLMHSDAFQPTSILADDLQVSPTLHSALLKIGGASDNTAPEPQIAKPDSPTVGRGSANTSGDSKHADTKPISLPNTGAGVSAAQENTPAANPEPTRPAASNNSPNVAPAAESPAADAQSNAADAHPRSYVGIDERPTQSAAAAAAAAASETGNATKSDGANPVAITPPPSGPRSSAGRIRTRGLGFNVVWWTVGFCILAISFVAGLAWARYTQ